MSFLMPKPKQQFFSLGGLPLIGGKIYTYAAGTSTPKATTTETGAVQANPIILNARGEPGNAIFWDGAYKVEVRDALNNLIYTVDNYQTPVVPSDLSSVSAGLGAGLVGFAYAVAYPAGSIGKWLQNLATSAGATFMGFIQAGAGTVLRTVESKLRDRVSVFDYLTAAQITDATSGAPTLDLSVPLNAAIATGKNLFWPQAIYLCNLTIPNTNRFDWQGDGSKKSILKAFTSASPVVSNYFQDPDWCYSSISDMGISGAAVYPGPYSGIGFCMGDQRGYPTGYAAGMHLVGRVVFNRVQFRGLSKGIYKPYGNIGNSFYACTWQWHDYGYYAKGVPALTHAGDDYFDAACQLNACEIAAICVLDATPGTGDWKINGTIQYNKGFGVFMDFGIGNAFRPIQMDFWDEANGTAYTPGPVATVTIDTLAGPVALAPKGKSIRGLRDFIDWGHTGLANGIGTTNPSAPLGIWGNQRAGLNLIAGGFGASWTQLGFSEEGQEATSGAYIRSNLIAGTSRDLYFATATGTQFPMWMKETGSVLMGTDAVIYGVPSAGAHVMYGPTSTAGARILELSARFGAPAYINVADAAGYNAALSVFNVGKVTSSGRSINAGGTVNASGADYAEYERNNGLTIQKGAIVGFKADGTLTLTFAEAVRFGVKSTAPSYVGGDTWGSVETLGARPLDPALLPAYEATIEAARALVDRVAYSGKVPCNVTGATPGGYIVAVNSNGAIGGQFVAVPTFDQYKTAVGRVNRVLPDGRAEIAVIVH